MFLAPPSLEMPLGVVVAFPTLPAFPSFGSTAIACNPVIDVSPCHSSTWRNLLVEVAGAALVNLSGNDIRVLVGFSVLLSSVVLDRTTVLLLGRSIIPDLRDHVLGDAIVEFE